MYKRVNLENECLRFGDFYSKVRWDTYSLELTTVIINEVSQSTIAKLHIHNARLSRHQERKSGEHHGSETTATPQRDMFDRPELVLFRLFKHKREAISPAYRHRGASMPIWEGDPRRTLRS